MFARLTPASIGLAGTDFFKAFEKKNDQNNEEEEGDENPESYEVKGDYKLVDMPAVERKTGEEDEDII